MLKESLDTFLTELEDIKSGKRNQRITSAGLSSLDDNLNGGFEQGQLIILGSRPGMGKSALGAQFAKKAALQGKKAVFFSLEMPERELIGRLIASEGSITYPDIRQAFGGKNAPEPDFYPLLEEACGTLSELPLHIVDRAGIYVETMRQQAVDAQPDFIVVDYLQLVRTRAKYDVREQQVAEVSRQLKEMAKECKCPVVALAQLNRQVEMRVNKRPMISDLRESGSLEQDADVVMFMYREGYYNQQKKEDGTTELIVPKQRAGSPFTIECYFEPKYMQFIERNSW